MKNVAKPLIAAALSAGLLTAQPISAMESVEWLKRQFSTGHEAPTMPGVGQSSVKSAPQPDNRTSHEVAADWVERLLAGRTPRHMAPDGIAGRAGPALPPASEAPDAEAWLQRQFSTDHTLPRR